jgi:hypothetical protein
MILRRSRENRSSEPRECGAGWRPWDIEGIYMIKGTIAGYWDYIVAVLLPLRTETQIQARLQPRKLVYSMSRIL